MKFSAFVGWGVVIYAIMRLTWDGLVIHGYSTGLMPRSIELGVLILLCVMAGRALRFSSWKDIVPYSISWAVIAGLLDVVYAVPYSGWSLYSDWNVWFGYGLVALLPLLAPSTRRMRDEMPHIS